MKTYYAKFKADISKLVCHVQQILKRSKLDNFLGGLIIGAGVSILVALMTNQIQDQVLRQRVLEVLENEIRSNYILAAAITGNYNEPTMERFEEDRQNYFYILDKYSNNLWFQSSESLRYAFSLDSDIQVALSVFYTYTLPRANAEIDKYNETIGNRLAECERSRFHGEKFDKPSCNADYELMMKLEDMVAKQVGQSAWEILNKFHPTKDRKENFWLSLFIGQDAMVSRVGVQ